MGTQASRLQCSDLRFLQLYEIQVSCSQFLLQVTAQSLSSYSSLLSTLPQATRCDTRTLINFLHRTPAKSVSGGQELHEAYVRHPDIKSSWQQAGGTVWNWMELALCLWTSIGSVPCWGGFRAGENLIFPCVLGVAPLPSLS